MYIEDFPIRLSKLREAKGVSARDMSLSIGQNSGYINNIENGKGLPSLTAFFYICEYLDITPCDFLKDEIQNPQKLNDLVSHLEKLDDEQLDALIVLARGLEKNK